MVPDDFDVKSPTRLSEELLSSLNGILILGKLFEELRQEKH